MSQMAFAYQLPRAKSADTNGGLVLPRSAPLLN